jgi:hypothetical protein
MPVERFPVDGSVRTFILRTDETEVIRFHRWIKPGFDLEAATFFEIVEIQLNRRGDCTRGWRQSECRRKTQIEMFCIGADASNHRPLVKHLNGSMFEKSATENDNG